MDHPLPQMDLGAFRRLPAADGAAVRHRLVPGQSHGLPLKGRLDLGGGQGQLVQGMKAVKGEGQQLRLRLALLGQRLGHLGKITGQGQLLQVSPHPFKPTLRRCLLHRPAPLVLVQGELPPAQLLAGRRGGAALPAHPPGGYGHLTLICGEGGEDLVRFLVVHFPEHQGLCGQMHGAVSS